MINRYRFTAMVAAAFAVFLLMDCSAETVSEYDTSPRDPGFNPSDLTNDDTAGRADADINPDVTDVKHDVTDVKHDITDGVSVEILDLHPGETDGGVPDTALPSCAEAPVLSSLSGTVSTYSEPIKVLVTDPDMALQPPDEVVLWIEEAPACVNLSMDSVSGSEAVSVMIALNTNAPECCGGGLSFSLHGKDACDNHAVLTFDFELPACGPDYAGFCSQEGFSVYVDTLAGGALTSSDPAEGTLSDGIRDDFRLHVPRDIAVARASQTGDGALKIFIAEETGDALGNLWGRISVVTGDPNVSGVHIGYTAVKGAGNEIEIPECTGIPSGETPVSCYDTGGIWAMQGNLRPAGAVAMGSLGTVGYTADISGIYMFYQTEQSRVASVPGHLVPKWCICKLHHSDFGLYVTGLALDEANARLYVLNNGPANAEVDVLETIPPFEFGPTVGAEAWLASQGGGLAFDEVSGDLIIGNTGFGEVLRVQVEPGTWPPDLTLVATSGDTGLTVGHPAVHHDTQLLVVGGEDEGLVETAWLPGESGYLAGGGPEETSYADGPAAEARFESAGNWGFADDDEWGRVVLSAVRGEHPRLRVIQCTGHDCAQNVSPQIEGSVPLQYEGAIPLTVTDTDVAAGDRIRLWLEGEPYCMYVVPDTVTETATQVELIWDGTCACGEQLDVVLHAEDLCQGHVEIPVSIGLPSCVEDFCTYPGAEIFVNTVAGGTDGASSVDGTEWEGVTSLVKFNVIEDLAIARPSKSIEGRVQRIFIASWNFGNLGRVSVLTNDLVASSTNVLYTVAGSPDSTQGQAVPDCSPTVAPDGALIPDDCTQYGGIWGTEAHLGACYPVETNSRGTVGYTNCQDGLLRFYVTNAMRPAPVPAGQVNRWCVCLMMDRDADIDGNLGLTGLALDEADNRLYMLDNGEDAIKAISTAPPYLPSFQTLVEEGFSVNVWYGGMSIDHDTGELIIGNSETQEVIRAIPDLIADPPTVSLVSKSPNTCLRLGNTGYHYERKFIVVGGENGTAVKTVWTDPSLEPVLMAGNLGPCPYGNGVQGYLDGLGANAMFWSTEHWGITDDNEFGAIAYGTVDDNNRRLRVMECAIRTCEESPVLVVENDPAIYTGPVEVEISDEDMFFGDDIMLSLTGEVPSCIYMAPDRATGVSPATADLVWTGDCACGQDVSFTLTAHDLCGSEYQHVFQFTLPDCL